MQYRYVSERANYEDFASGRVLYYQRGTTAFPARLASEVFQWCQAYLVRGGSAGPYTLYDPCCGGAYLLTTLGFLHRESLRGLVASDVDEGAVALAADNLGLLSVAGIDRRIAQIRGLLAEYGKEAHALALESAARLRALLQDEASPGGPGLGVTCFKADATDAAAIAERVTCVDVVIADMPYGNMAEWQGPEEARAVEEVLGGIRGALAPVAVVAIVTQKGVPVEHTAYERVKRFSIGKRQVVLLSPRAS